MFRGVVPTKTALTLLLNFKWASVSNNSFSALMFNGTADFPKTAKTGREATVAGSRGQAEAALRRSLTFRHNFSLVDKVIRGKPLPWPSRTTGLVRGPTIVNNVF